jgi:hypothetical protein
VATPSRRKIARKKERKDHFIYLFAAAWYAVLAIARVELDVSPLVGA